MSSDVQIDASGEVCRAPLVVTAFAKDLDKQQIWQPLVNQIITTIAEAFNLEHTNGAPLTSHVRYLDESIGRKTTVAEITLSPAKSQQKTLPPLTLEQCTALCNSEPLQTLQKSNAVELILQPSELYAEHRLSGLAVFDMDSTLIQQEVIDELARRVNKYDQVAAITEAAMRGEAPYTDFETSLRKRVELLKDVPMSVWEELKKDAITLTPGGKALVQCLKSLGWKTAVLSGGFTPLALWVQETLGLDYAFANHLVSDTGTNLLTGELVAEMPIIHAAKKRELLLQLAAENNIPVKRTIAVGDGSNDLLMMSAAGLGVAFNAKPKVQRAAPARLNSASLLDVIHIMGYTRDEAESMLHGLSSSKEEVRRLLAT